MVFTDARDGTSEEQHREAGDGPDEAGWPVVRIRDRRTVVFKGRRRPDVRVEYVDGQLFVESDARLEVVQLNDHSLTVEPVR